MSSVLSGTWCCSSGDDQEMWEAWRLSAQPKSASWVMAGLACAGESAGCWLRPWTLSANTLLQEIHEVSGVGIESQPPCMRQGEYGKGLLPLPPRGKCF